MRKYISEHIIPVSKILALLLLGATLTGCDQILGTLGGGDLPENRDDEAVNEKDPENPNFRLSDIVLLDGRTFGEEFTVTESSFTLSWQVDPNDNGYADSLVYTFEVTSPDGEKSGITKTESSVNINYLNETLGSETYSYSIVVGAKGTTKTSEPFTGTFKVNAVGSKGFIFRDRAVESNNDGSYTVDVYVDEMISTDAVNAISLELVFDQSVITTSVSDIQVYTDAESYLNQGDSNNIISVPEVDNSTGRVNVYAGVVGSLSGKSGAGKFCSITFTPNGTLSSASTISIGSNSVFKSEDGSDVVITDFDEAVLY